MRQDDRAPFDRALHRARVSAYAPGEFVGQESFMSASEIRALAVQAGVGAGVAVLDLCAASPGPGGSLRASSAVPTWEWTPAPSAVAIARERAGAEPCRFTVAHIPPLPAGPFDVVLLLETMLAFEDKDALVRAVAATLRPSGRFAFTLEEGPPLTAAERAAMPDADTVWLTPLEEMATSLKRAGLSSRARRITAVTPRDRAGTGVAFAATPSGSPRRSAAGHWANYSPPTGCGSSGSTRGGCESSRSWRSRP